MSNLVADYLERWERYASVRSHPRKKFIIENNNSGHYFYPPNKQVLCLHPNVMDLGEEAKQFILTQSFYKYANDIAMIETEVINQTVMGIANQRLPLVFEFSLRQIAMSVLTDESYHAFVALDSMNQVERLTGITPLKMPMETDLSYAIMQSKKLLDASYFDIFDLIVVCIAENTLTKELISIHDEPEVNSVFKHIIREHLADESRHARFFQTILPECWEQLDDTSQNAIGEVLPYFLRHYLSTEIQISFDKEILYALNFNTKQVEKIIKETHGVAYQVTKHHPMIKNILNLLDKSLLLAHSGIHAGLVAENLL